MYTYEGKHHNQDRKSPHKHKQLENSLFGQKCISIESDQKIQLAQK